MRHTVKFFSSAASRTFIATVTEAARAADTLSVTAAATLARHSAVQATTMSSCGSNLAGALAYTSRAVSTSSVGIPEEAGKRFADYCDLSAGRAPGLK